MRLKTASVVNAFVLAGYIASPGDVRAGASGPTVGNPDVNEAADEPEQPARVRSRKTAAVSDGPPKLYALVDGKHIISDYFDEKNQRIRRDPAFHARLQLGARLYGDKLDLSAAVGAVKMPASQAIFQKRPEILADVYAVKTQYFNLLWYNMLQVPVREADRDPGEFSDSDLYEQDAKRGIDASVFTVGLAPVAKYERRMAGGKYLVRAGGDAWTKLYSKPLYVDESNAPGGEGVSLVSTGFQPGDKEFEDRAVRYVHQESLAVGFTPHILPALAFDVGAHIESRYIPKYFRDDGGGWDYTYFPERRSFWRTRLSYDLNQTWSIQDELFVFRNGFFAENRVNDERRYKNIIRLAAKL